MKNDQPYTLVLVIEEHNDGKEIYERCLNRGAVQLLLAGISGVNWERDLSPWSAEPAFKKAPPFTGEADQFLHELEDLIIPDVQHQITQSGLTQKPQATIFAGYSLAGLFAVYSAFRADLFDGIVSASGSMWFPGFTEFAETHALSHRIKYAYFSIGDKEAKTRNIAMQSVENNTRRMQQLFSERGISSAFELNPGGHFVDDADRQAKGILWSLENCASHAEFSDSKN